MAEIRTRAGAGGLVLVVEDLHWAPEETVAALHSVLQRCGTTPLALIATSRDAAAHPEFTAMADHHVRLTGLGPPDLAAAIAAHTAHVPAGVLSALRIAAAVGDQFDLLTLGALPGPLHRGLTEWRDMIADAIRHGLVRPDATAGASSTAFHFVHALITEHLYQELTPAERVRAHAAIALALQRVSVGRPTPPDLIAYHFSRGWPEVPTADVVTALLAAARTAGAQLDFRQAVHYYRAALDHFALDPASASPEEIADVLGATAGASVAAGDLDGAQDLYSSQHRVASAAKLTRWSLFAQLGALRISFLRRSRPAVADGLAASLANVAHDEAATDASLIGECLAAVQVYQPARAEELLRATSHRHPSLRAPLKLAVWEHLSVAGQLATARDLASDFTTRTSPRRPAFGAGERPTGDPGATPSTATAIWLRLWVSEVAAGLRRLDDPPPRLSGPGAPETIDDQTAFDLDQWRVTCAIATGDLGRAQRLIDTALAGPRHPDPAERAGRTVSFYGQQLYLAMVSGQLTGQETPLESNLTWVTRHPLMRYLRAYLDSISGDTAGRDRCAELVDEIADADIPDSDLVPRLILVTEVCRRFDDTAGLEVCRDALVHHRGEHGIFRFGQYWGAADRSLGDARLTLGDLDGAIADYRRAVEGLTAVGAHRHLPGARAALDGALALGSSPRAHR